MDVRHDEGERRFTMDTPAGPAVLSYTALPDGTLDLQHTSVPSDERGEGIGGRLVEAALAHARREGVRIVPSCPFVRGWLGRNPGHEDLVATGTGS